MPAAVRKWHAEVALLLLMFCSWEALGPRLVDERGRNLGSQVRMLWFPCCCVCLLIGTWA